MAIHLVQRSQAYDACKKSSASDDVVVLLGDGVMAAIQGAGDCYATESDVLERAIESRIQASIKLITDAELVLLCAALSPVVSWNQP